jgi:hypothetical protein
MIEAYEGTKPAQRRAADAFDVEEVFDLPEMTLLAPLV